MKKKTGDNMPVKAINGRDVNCSHGCGFYTPVPIVKGETSKKNKKRMDAAWETVELHENEKHNGPNMNIPPEMLRLYYAMPMFGRNYVDQQRVRIAAEHRMRRMKELGFEEDDELYLDQLGQQESARDAEKTTLKTAYNRLNGHPLYDYCEIVKGYGPVACLTYMSFIDPFKANTSGKSKAYFGVIPDAKRISGEKASYNLEAKGRTYVLLSSIMMQKEPTYYDLYLQKKAMLTEKTRIAPNHKGEQVDWPPFSKILEDPTVCPRYPLCAKKLAGTAKRQKRKPKKPSCKGHLDNMAKRYVWGIMISHASELMREALGLDVSAYKAHRGYLSPKRIKDW